MNPGRWRDRRVPSPLGHAGSDTEKAKTTTYKHNTITITYSEQRRFASHINSMRIPIFFYREYVVHRDPSSTLVVVVVVLVILVKNS